jgi:predicted RNA-binding Zn ribbon-like protein
MKDLFRGYYQLDSDEFKQLWAECTFVFDANVLLNLYRYQTSTRDALFEAMENVKERVWIPFQVGMEFQINRLKVIADQHKRFGDVRRSVNRAVDGLRKELEGLQLKKRHSYIDPDKLIEGMQELRDDFLKELTSLEKKSLQLSDIDEIRERIDKLFEGRMGDPPSNQRELADLFEVGEARFERRMPPGFEDGTKEDGEEPQFYCGGLNYIRKFGDLVVWEQMKQFASDGKVESLIFVTDDKKSDWWRKTGSSRKKVFGPRPELIEEILIEAKVQRFYIYDTEGFLTYAKRELMAEVTDAALEEIREVSAVQPPPTGAQRAVRGVKEVEVAVFDWLSSDHSMIHLETMDFPDFVAEMDEGLIGFEVIISAGPSKLRKKLHGTIQKACQLVNRNDFERIELIVVCPHFRGIDQISEAIRDEYDSNGYGFSVTVGVVVENEPSEKPPYFVPMDYILV